MNKNTQGDCQICTTFKNILSFQQRGILFKSFLKHSLNISILYGRSVVEPPVTNKFHERALKIVYDDYNSKFEELLTKAGSFTIRHQNIQAFGNKNV